LRSLQEIQPDFEEEVKAYAGLWSQGKNKKKNVTLFFPYETTMGEMLQLTLQMEFKTRPGSAGSQPYIYSQVRKYTSKFSSNS
jgi:hypothetical protein